MHSYRALWLVILNGIIAIASILVVPGNSTAQQNQRLVESVEITGNRRLRRDDILYYVQTRPGDPYNEQQVQRDFSNAEEPKSRQAILVVDDDPDVLMFIVATLRRGGYTVFGAQSGREAMSVLTQQKHLIGIVLTDVVMPSLNGPELAERLVAVNPDLTVLYMSGYKEEHLAR
ncbi:MAG TPA: response regulator, partial [Pyrinomonadaceae bacterium]